MDQNSGNPQPVPPAGSGIAPNVAGALSYVLGWVTGLVFLMIEKNDKTVRFHAYQSIFLSVAWIAFLIGFNVISSILGNIPFLGFLVAIIGVLIMLGLGLGMLVLVVMLIIKAYQGQQWKLPYIGEMAERYAARG